MIQRIDLGSITDWINSLEVSFLKEFEFLQEKKPKKRNIRSLPFIFICRGSGGLIHDSIKSPKEDKLGKMYLWWQRACLLNAVQFGGNWALLPLFAGWTKLSEIIAGFILYNGRLKNVDMGRVQRTVFCVMLSILTNNGQLKTL